MNLEPEESGVCAVSEDLIAQSLLTKDYVSGGYECESKTRCEVKEFTDVNSTTGAETSTSLNCTDSSDQLSDFKYEIADVKQEYSLETSLTFPSSNLLGHVECSNTSSQSYMKMEPDSQMHDLPVLMDVKEDDESDGEALDAYSSATEETDVEGETTQGFMSQESDSIDQLNRCPLCMTIFSSLRFLERHVLKQHVNEGQRHTNHCAQCEKVYTNRASLKRHVKSAHEDNGSSRTRTRISAVQSEERPHKCPRCDACFAHESKLMQHITTVHDHIKPYECSECDKRFSHRQHRDTHFKSVHCGERPYSCDQCDFRFSEKKNLIRHQSTHDEVKSFACNQCEYKSATKTFLKKHLTAVHNQQKLHKCNDCGRVFSRAYALETHTDAVHRGIRPFSCTDCDSTFSVKSSLQRHVKSMHHK